MKLTEIKLSGFKSFAKPTTLHFKDGLTAIIGPNGSGKSNLAEAVRWVLGEQSAKQLRGNASTDVIFTGNQDQPKSNKASVSLVFDNESGNFPIEAATIAITRSLSRSGQSEYLLNNDPIRLIDLQQIIAEAGIGAKSYAVISQGTVDKYLTATPTQRRELFDEATGIKSLQIKIHQSENKLKQVNQHIHELNTIIAELEPRLRVLKRQADKQEERDKYSQEYESKQTIWFHHTWKEMESNIKEAQINIEKNQKNVDEARANRQILEEKILAYFQKNGSSEDSLKKQIEKETKKYYQDNISYEENKRLRAELRSSIDKVKKQLTIAQAELNKAREDKTENWTDNIKDTLTECLDLLARIKNKQPLTKKYINKLAENINRSLELTTNNTNTLKDKSSVTAIEYPLQEVARLQAITQERQQQLTAFPKLTEPSSEKIKELQKQLADQKNKPASHNITDAKKELEEARNKEVYAERKGQAAELALEQAQNELLNLKTTILRERGTVFLQEIQKKDPANIPPPTEQELLFLAQKLAAIGEIDPLALKEYTEVSERYDHLTNQLKDILATKQHIENLKQKLQREMTIRFHDQLKIIQASFTEYFTHLFGGGQAELILEEDGIDISACPPGKRTRHLNLLSGGEKALTSLALLFAILKAQKPPFLMLDEVDAALDEANADRFAQALKGKSLEIQCIVITHNRQTMSQADVLYGVTMNKSSHSKLYSVNLKDHDITAKNIAA